MRIAFWFLLALSSMPATVSAQEGLPCDAGWSGICAVGITTNQDGSLVCVQQQFPATEVCDQIDNDCDGDFDEEILCPSGQVCSHGECQPAITNEADCPAGTELNIDRCVELECSGVYCVEGTACRTAICFGRYEGEVPCVIDGVEYREFTDESGLSLCGVFRLCSLDSGCAPDDICPDGPVCVNLCKDAVCPPGQWCQNSACVDLCSAVTCGEGEICELGACLPHCSAAGCAEGLACAEDGHCVEQACANVSCATSEICREGVCADRCDGVACPGEAACSDGICGVPPPVFAQIALGAAGSGTAGATTSAAGASSEGTPTTASGGSSGDGASSEGSGCGCRVGGTGGDFRFAGWWLLALCAVGLERRRRGIARERWG